MIIENLICDINQYQRFINLLPELENDQVYFLSLSARNKYLSKEQRDFYCLGRTEMFCRKTAKSKDQIEKRLMEMAFELQYKRTGSGKLFPKEALVVYFNINPSSMRAAYNSFRAIMNNCEWETAQALLGGRHPSYEPYLKMNRRLMNCIQKERAYRYFVDIDIDTGSAPTETIVKSVHFNKLLQKGIGVKTKSGYHILFKVGDMSREINESVRMTHNFFATYHGEAAFNINAMIPLPGTQQAGELVTFVEPQ